MVVRMTDEEVLYTADILEDLIGNNFHDAIAHVMQESDLGNDWFVSDEDIHRVKIELASYLIRMTK